MTKECECAAHSAAECVCGAWDEPQRQWVGLTDEERKACMRLSEYHIEEVARAVEDTLKRKNT